MREQSIHYVPFARPIFLLVASAVCPAAMAEQALVDLAITPGDTTNRLTMTVSATIPLGTRSDTQFPAVAGNLLADLDLDYDYATHRVSGVEGLTLTGGRFIVSDTAFRLDWGFLAGRVDLTGTGLSGTFMTPAPPGTVTAGQFDAAEHRAVIDGGTLSARGTGLVGALLPANPYVVDLTAQPITVGGDGVGVIVVEDPSVIGNVATYGLTIRLPAVFDQVVYEEPGTATVTARGQGAFEARGQLVRILPSEWDVDGGGSWGTAANWRTGPVPDAPGAGALFGGRVSGLGPATVTLDGDRTLGSLIFDNPVRHVLAAGTGGGTLRIDGGGKRALINVVRGSHRIEVPVELRGHTTVDVAAASELATSDGVTSAERADLVKEGAGTFVVDGPIELGSAGAVDVRGGTLSAERVVAGTLRVGPSGVARLAAGGGGPTVVDELTLAGSTGHWAGTLDVGAGAVVVRADAANAAQVLERSVDQVKHARDGAVRWAGAGITSSQAMAASSRGVVVLLNAAGDGTRILTSIDGLALTPTDVVVRSSWNGDANLDGRLNADDYFRIDSGFLAQLANPTYHDGDFNYDAKVNADDYFLIDSAFLDQQTLGAVTATGAMTAVPEPGLGGGAAIVASIALRRRARR